MSQVLVTESYLDDIADAIREKNGSEDTYTPAQMAGAIEDIHTADEVVLVSKSVNANGTYNPASDSADGYSGVTVNVPNSYAAGDEGKVVSNGALVAQSARSSDITENGTYDTTLNNEVTVDVSGGGGGDVYIQNPPIAITTNNNTNLLNIQDGWIGEFLSEKSTFFPIDDQGNTLDVDWRKPFEICVPFKYSQKISRSMVLFGSAGGGYCYTPSIELSSSGGGIWCGFSTNGSSWDYAIAFTSPDDISLQANKKYIVKAKWDGTDYTVSVDDGDTKITKSITPTSAHYYSPNRKIVFGGMVKSSNHYAMYVKMYLPEMYISSQGIKIWHGNTPT